MSVRFRNVDASIADEVGTWPYEALVACIERGLVADWQPIFAELRKHPWGEVARRVDFYTTHGDDPAATRLFGLAVVRARQDAEAAERNEVAGRIRAAVTASGLSARAFAAEIGTSSSRLSTYASGRVTPSAAMLVRIERFAGTG